VVWQLQIADRLGKIDDRVTDLVVRGRPLNDEAAIFGQHTLD